MEKKLVQRKKIRLVAYDYSQQGAYSITICCKNKNKILAEIYNSEEDEPVLFYPIGEICKIEIEQIAKRFQISVDKYVIMPNHIHIIFFIDEEKTLKKHTIGDAVCGFKSITTKAANKLENTLSRKIWQRLYYDHIIRNEKEYQEIWQYIDENPLKLQQDCFYV